MGRSRPSRTWLLVIGLGLYLTCRGYHSRDGDQAYRLPLLLHQQDQRLFAGDPFVDALQDFNPHRGFLILLDATSRPLGLSVGLASLFFLSFVLTAIGIDRLARAVWPDSGPAVVGVAALMLFTAKAGNLGTNHLFEAMLLDRLLAMALGWLALAEFVEQPARSRWRTAALLGAAAFIHPSVGLQLTLWLAAAMIGRGIVSRSRWTETFGSLSAIGLALLPWFVMISGQSARLLKGLDPETYLVLAAQIQSPQHMLPHLWRLPQWLAAGSYLILGVIALRGARDWPPARSRLILLLGINLAGLLIAWLAIERLHDLRATIFQPFRMATPARGLCLVLTAGYVHRLWSEGISSSRARATMIVVALTGDWSLVAVTGVELAYNLGRLVGERTARCLGLVALAIGLTFLFRHDTENGQYRLLGAIGLALIAARYPWPRTVEWSMGRLARVTAMAWILPVAALLAGWLPVEGAPRWVDRLAEHCRFVERPVDEVERLALWCREHTSTEACFVGPPGPKTFRLWSRRTLAFNRASSPYHASGLADWADRFRLHVRFEGSATEFARAYLDDRQALERRFEAMTSSDLAELAAQQGSGFVLASSRYSDEAAGPLQTLRIDGSYAVYRVRESDPPGQAVAAGPLDSPRR